MFIQFQNGEQDRPSPVDTVSQRISSQCSINQGLEKDSEKEKGSDDSLRRRELSGGSGAGDPNFGEQSSPKTTKTAPAASEWNNNTAITSDKPPSTADKEDKPPSTSEKEDKPPSTARLDDSDDEPVLNIDEMMEEMDED